MFFLLSKTLGVALIPVNALLLTGLSGVALLMAGFMRWGRRLVTVSIVLLALCGFTPLGYALLYPLEQRFPAWDPARGAPHGIIILGGSIDPDTSAARGVAVIGDSSDRIIVGAQLALQYPQARLLFTGGSSNLVAVDAKEADWVPGVFEKLGIPKSRLIIERASRNTQENAEFSRALVSPAPGQRWLLVTSAYHMPRSVGLFRKAGFDVEPYPVDWRVGGAADLLAFTKFAGDGLKRTDTAVREWIGLVAYRVAGRTDQLFPAP